MWLQYLQKRSSKVQGVAHKCIHMTVMLICSLFLVACAVKQPAYDDARDPWEGYNRAIFSFNEGVDKILLKPVAQGYRKITPDVVEGSIHNFFSNLQDVPVTINEVLQGKFAQAGSDVLRLLINSTIGILGLFDVATGLGYAKHEEDFGQTLAVWGVGAGPYFVVPIIGGSTVRDFPGTLVDRLLLHPIAYIGDSDTELWLNVADAVHLRANFLDQEAIIRQWSPDFYVAVRNYYLSRREALIKDGKVDAGDDAYEDLEIE